jgi:hypothetical protein
MTLRHRPKSTCVRQIAACDHPEYLCAGEYRIQQLYHYSLNFIDVHPVEPEVLPAADDTQPTRSLGNAGYRPRCAMCGWYLSPHPPLAGCPGARSSRCSDGDRLIGEPVGASYGYVHRWQDSGESVINKRRSFERIAGCGREVRAPRPSAGCGREVRAPRPSAGCGREVRAPRPSVGCG